MLQTSQTPSKDEIKAKCRTIIDRFAHREVLREADIRDWLASVIGMHGEAAIWHATRASGFGGSDIGVLVRNFQGHRADHQASAHEIIEGKLLRRLPDEDTCHLRRGHENEAAHAQRYYVKYAVRDEAAFLALTRATGLRPWMRYSPDEVALHPSDRPNPNLGGRNVVRILGDYKAPSVVDGDAAVHFQYACQLHQGGMICAANGIHLDGLQLSQFDWAHWELKDDYVPYDPELAKLILAAGDHYADFVMRGEVPPYVFTPKFEKQDELAALYGERGQVLAQVVAMSKAMEKEADFRSDELKASLQGFRLAGTKLSLGDLSVTCVTMVDHNAVAKVVTKEEAAALRKAKPGKDVSWDAEAMALRLSELGVDPMQYRTDKFDPDLAYEFLAAKGLDPEQFMTEQIRIAPSKFLKDQAIDMVTNTYPRVSVSPSPAESMVAAADVSPEGQVTATDIYEAEADVRDGQLTDRLAQRTAMV